MEKIEILAVGTNEKVLETIVRLINANRNWHASGAGSSEEAIALFKQKDFDLVLLGAGIDDEETLKKRLQSLKSDVTCIEHYGGGSGLLSCEIIQALKERQSLQGI